MNQTCKCGFDQHHKSVTHKCNYTYWGWFLLTILGMSAKPKSVDFVCIKCNVTILTTSEHEVLTKYIGR